MTLDQFLGQLLDEGRVRVDRGIDADGTPRPLAPDERQAAEARLIAFESVYRDDLAGVPPALDLTSALWAAQQVYRACALLAHRDVGADVATRILSQPVPRHVTDAVTYSVDLTFRFLPDLIRIAQAASSADPVTLSLREWAGRWPLSSVGVAGVTVAAPLQFLSHPCLRQLYVDRIMARRDLTRLDEPTTRGAVLEALGAYPELAREIAEKLQTFAPS